MDTTNILETLIVSGHRLTRLSAQTTGSAVSSAVWTSLSILTTDGPHRIGDLARAARISQPGMTKILQTLVEDEWVRRIAVADDSRAWLIAITPKGAEALASWRAQLADAMRPVFADLTDDDWDVLSRAAELLSSRVSVGMAAA